MIVIKLKQVEHVRNERKTLADVSGHPFITTLIASFSDDQNLYMLVRSLDPSVFLPRATNPHPV
jgi:serine/threonine protein kinase